MKENIKNKYRRWKQYVMQDIDLVNELNSMENNDEKIENSFYKDLTFGTGGLRGVIGAGTNCMNVYTVAKTSQGIADYILENFEKEEHKIAVAYDSRLKSELFARIVSEVFAANEIKVFLYSELMPTPCLSYAVRKLGCAVGIMITASHNPAKYNGYKVYGNDGCQITTEIAEQITREIDKLDIFEDVKQIEFDVAVEAGKITYIPSLVYDEFIEDVKSLSVLKEEVVDKNIAIVFSPLNGTGLKPVLRVLKESGYSNITVVKEQELPDGNFPTCPYPNPEIKEAMALGVEYARRCNADLLLATDPDCDRIGIAVKNAEGEYQLLSGNETGILLLDYVCERRKHNGSMPKNPVIIKTIVTTDMAERIAEHYGVRTINVLTGFKFIGEQIGLLEREGKKESYILGFEESFGYLSGTHVRDKDGVNGAFLICEMYTYYATKGISLLEKLNQLYESYGYCLNTLHSYEFEGAAGFEKMQNIMQKFRADRTCLGEKKIVEILDYKQEINELPKSDVLKIVLEEGCSVVVRPSGTEPKIKIYLTIIAKNNEEAKVTELNLIKELEKLLD